MLVKLKEKMLEVGMEPRQEVLNLLRGEDSTVKIPSKVEKKLDRIPNKKFQAIHEDPAVAKELCMLILSNFSETWSKSFNVSDNSSARNGYKRLYSPFLASQVKYNCKKSSPYKRILELLIEEGIIEPGAKYSVEDGRSNEYKLTKIYYGKGVVSYILKTAEVKKLRGRDFVRNFERAIQTNLGRNSLMLRSLVIFPTSEEVREHLKKAVKDNYTNKKRKRLIELKKNSKNTYPETEYVYLEDYLALFEYLRDHLKIPIVSPFMADERIIDGFNMMPSLIRQLFTIHGRPIVENDYVCLHPNIAQMLYSDINQEGITHDKVAEWLCVDRAVAKVEHLSYFNKTWEQLERSPLHEFYMNNDYRMMENICKEKAEKGYKSTSRELFRVETNIMELVVRELNRRGIIVMYVFDAIYSADTSGDDVAEVMNRVARRYKVRSEVKVKNVNLSKAA